jgi:two-component system response regulator FixJ
MPNKVIARWLALSPRTVEAYRANMMVKIGVTGMSNALRIAIDGGLPGIEAGKDPRTPEFQISIPTA